MFHLRQKGATSRSTKRRTKLRDREFGEISWRRSSTAKYVRVRLMPNGRLSATLPSRAPLRAIQELIDQARPELRTHLQTVPAPTLYQDGQRIGHSHTLRIKTGRTDNPTYSFAGQLLTAIIPETWNPKGSEAQDYLRALCTKALQKEARAYLPRRLSYLAKEHGFSYAKLRYGNPKGRWGSYSSNGTISLNIALMNLPHELIDYVLIHELCHARHPHHQASFWAEVARYAPDYRAHRTDLKKYSPYL